MAYPYYGDDGWDYDRGRRPSPRRNVSDYRRSHVFLDPNQDAGGLYRTRSQGAGPVPVVNVFNDVAQDNNQRAVPPYPPYPPSPGHGRRDRLGEELVDAIDELTLERRRSRSRGRSDVGFIDRREDYYDWERRRRSEEERIKDRLELERVRSDQEAKDREKRIIDDYKRREREEEDDRKEEEKRIREKIKQEEIDAKEKEEREWKEFLRKQKEKEDEDARKKKEKEEEIDEALRERFWNMGYSKEQADMMIERERMRRTGKAITSTTTTTSTALARLEAPTYAKVKAEYIAVETLKYYGIPWEYDRKDKRYIIILREMTESETDVLFEHTKQLREKKLPLLLEPPKDKPQYAFYRKRDRSTSRVRKSGILKYED